MYYCNTGLCLRDLSCYVNAGATKAGFRFEIKTKQWHLSQSDTSVMISMHEHALPSAEQKKYQGRINFTSVITIIIAVIKGDSLYRL